MNSFLNYMHKEHMLKRLIIFIIGVFILAINYNLFIVPNSFVLGGASGIAIILDKLFNINPVISIYVINTILIFVSAIFLGNIETRRAIIGSLLYPLFITLTAPLAQMIIPHITFNNILVTIMVCGCLHGLGTGLIYKVGFNTGGGDILIKMVQKYLIIPDGSASFMCNSIILVSGWLVFGINIIIYSIIVLIISKEILDRILIGISDSKMFFIYSKKYKEIEKYLLQDLHTGVTLFNTEGAYKKVRREMLMVVVPTRDYYRVKENVLEIDNDAFFVVSDCYEVTGGIRRKNLPFI